MNATGKTYKLCLTLKSDALFGRGDGVAGLVDAEVEHDEYGMPRLRGRTLKGLLLEEADNIIYVLSEAQGARWRNARNRLFGTPGASLEEEAILHIGDAQLLEDLRQAIIADVKAKRYSPTEVLEALTTIRAQTAVSVDGTPAAHSLRTVRLILRETVFEAELIFREPPNDNDLAFLAACAKALRLAGTGRNRGLGRLKVRLCDSNGKELKDAWEHFTAALSQGKEAQA